MKDKISQLLQTAIVNSYLVELRVEDNPPESASSYIDTDIYTKLANATVDDKHLYIEASGLTLHMDYDSIDMGSESDSHIKFYFRSASASLTIVINF